MFVFVFIWIFCSWSSSFQNSNRQEFQNRFFPFHTLSYTTLVASKLTNLEELSFRTVFALPNVSKTGLVCTTWSSRLAFLMFPSLYSLAPTVAKYEMTFLVFSVFPAPDSPLKLHFILYYIQTKIVIEWQLNSNPIHSILRFKFLPYSLLHNRSFDENLRDKHGLILTIWNKKENQSQFSKLYLQWLDTTVAVNALHIFLEHPLILLICNMRICDKKHKNRNAADAYCLTYQNRPHRIQQIRVEAFRFFVYSDTYWQLVVCKWENVCRD